MSFKIEDDCLLVKYNGIWNKIWKILDIKLHTKLVYDEKYIKAKVKIFNGVINTVFLGDKIPKGGIHYICITAINIDSVMRKDKKNYPQVYREESKYKIKKKTMVKFIDAELDLDDSDDSNDSYSR